MSSDSTRSHDDAAMWERVCGLRPRLQDEATPTRHRVRGRRWIVLRDPMRGDCHRISAAAWNLVARLDGRCTIEAAWTACADELGEAAPSRAEAMHVIGLLQGAHVLSLDVSPDLEAMFRERRRARGQQRWMRLLSPLSIKVPLFDPDPLLERIAPFAAPIFTRGGAFFWALLVVTALLASIPVWPELAHDLPTRLLGGGGWLVLPLVYVFAKALHELAHGCAARVCGVEVRETGLAFLVFAPLPYIDVSGVSILPDKTRRIVVSLAGIAAELALAAIAFFVWSSVADGWVRAIALQMIWIGTLSTLLFNANPLLKFDGYYALADALEIPNLQQRASAHLIGSIQRRVFGLADVRATVDTESERPWLIAYGIASAIYRVVLGISIGWFVATTLPIVGVAIAALTIGLQIGLPLARGLAFVATSPRLSAGRVRAVSITAAAVVLAAVLLFALPLPFHSRTQGVVWPPERAQVRAEVDGLIVRQQVAPGEEVIEGQPLFVLEEPLLDAELAVLDARIDALELRMFAERADDLVRARTTEAELDTVRAERALGQARRDALVVRSPGAGRFLLAGALDPVGRMVRQGELLGHVVGAGAVTARVAVPQHAIEDVRQRTDAIELRLAGSLGRVRAARLVRAVPAATTDLPSAALGTLGGGPFAIDPNDEAGTVALEPVFLLEVELAEQPEQVAIGERVFVRFDHGQLPLAPRIGRSLARLFLGHFDV